MKYGVRYRLNMDDEKYVQTYELPDGAHLSAQIFPHHINLMFALDKESDLERNFYKVITNILDYEIVELTDD